MVVTAEAAKFVSEGGAVALRPGADFLSTKAFKAVSQTVVQHVKDFIKEHPALAGIERPELKQRMSKTVAKESVEFFDDVLGLLDILKIQCVSVYAGSVG